jgi:hypothetical protein
MISLSSCLTVAHPPSTIDLLPRLIITPFLIGLAKVHLVWLIFIFTANLSFMACSSPWWWRQYALLKHWCTLRLHGAMSQKAFIFVLAAMRTWNLTAHILSPLMMQPKYSGLVKTHPVYNFLCRYPWSEVMKQ